MLVLYIYIYILAWEIKGVGKRKLKEEGRVKGVFGEGSRVVNGDNEVGTATVMDAESKADRHNLASNVNP